MGSGTDASSFVALPLSANILPRAEPSPLEWHPWEAAMVCFESKSYCNGADLRENTRWCDISDHLLEIAGICRLCVGYTFNKINHALYVDTPTGLLEKKNWVH